MNDRPPTDQERLTDRSLRESIWSDCSNSPRNFQVQRSLNFFFRRCDRGKIRFRSYVEFGHFETSNRETQVQAKLVLFQEGHTYLLLPFHGIIC